MGQRKIFNEEKLIKILLNKEPCGVGMQRNGCYAVFYKRKDYYLKIILSKNNGVFEIVTFINSENIPDLSRLER